jgi:hypothetical protein
MCDQSEGQRPQLQLVYGDTGANRMGAPAAGLSGLRFSGLASLSITGGQGLTLGLTNIDGLWTTLGHRYRSNQPFCASGGIDDELLGERR